MELSELIKQLHPTATVSQRERIAAAFRATPLAWLGGALQDPVWKSLAETELGKITAGDPSLAAPIPSAEALLQHLKTQAESKGAPLSSVSALDHAHRLAAMDDDARLEYARSVGFDFKVTPSDNPDKPALTQTKELTTEQLDQLIRERMGLEVHQMTARQRQVYHGELRRLHAAKLTQSSTQATPVEGIPDLKGKSAAERIAAYRASQGKPS